MALLHIFGKVICNVIHNFSDKVAFNVIKSFLKEMSPALPDGQEPPVANESTVLINCDPECHQVDEAKGAEEGASGQPVGAAEVNVMEDKIHLDLLLLLFLVEGIIFIFLGRPPPPEPGARVALSLRRHAENLTSGLMKVPKYEFEIEN